MKTKIYLFAFIASMFFLASCTKDEEETSAYEYVDLGLSVKWATMNVGATKPEEYGDYFAWGETEPKTEYYWPTYLHCNGSATTLTKYCTGNYHGYNGFTDNKTVLDPEDDAAHVNWGGDWRMPTIDELDELCKKCTWIWTTLNGVNGYKVQGKKEGYTDNWIFLPAAGYRTMSNKFTEGGRGFYWSSSLVPEAPFSAFSLLRHYSHGSDWNYKPRYEGYSVRPVCP